MSSTNAASELRDILTKYCNHYRNIPEIESVRSLLPKVSEDLRYELFSSITDSDGDTALTRAAYRGHTELCVTLLSSLPPADRLELILVNKRTGLHRASSRGYRGTVSGILNCLTADQQLQLLFTRDIFNGTSLHVAAEEGDAETVKTLLDNLTPEQQFQLIFTQDIEGNTALHHAAQFGRRETVKTLLDNITPEQQLQLLFTQNKNSDTALHYAARWRHTEAVNTLLDNLTPEQQLKLLSVQNNTGKTASQLAGASKQKVTEKMLKKYERDADLEVNYGKWAYYHVMTENRGSN